MSVCGRQQALAKSAAATAGPGRGVEQAAFRGRIRRARRLQIDRHAATKIFVV
jgi:hypothetical protein